MTLIALIVAAVVVVWLATALRWVNVDARADRRALDFIRDPASITERDAGLRNELSRHVDEAGL